MNINKKTSNTSHLLSNAALLILKCFSPLQLYNTSVLGKVKLA